ncbi:MAG: hypothetical protein EOO38_22470, partial [Cytophagaceae bacterium]
MKRKYIKSLLYQLVSEKRPLYPSNSAQESPEYCQFHAQTDVRRHYPITTEEPEKWRLARRRVEYRAWQVLASAFPRKRAVPQTQATMTEQEAEALAARLNRVWVPEEYKNWAPERYPEDFGKDQFLFRPWITSRIRLEAGASDEFPSQGRRFFKLTNWSGPTGPHRNLSLGRLHVWADTGDITDSLPPSYVKGHKDYAEFSAQWMPIFRRNCWLS